MASLQRVTISVPSAVAKDLRRCSRILGLSQSAVVSTLIAADLRELAKRGSSPTTLATSPPRSSLKRRRLRGASAVVVRQTLAEALEAAANATAELPFGPVR